MQNGFQFIPLLIAATLGISVAVFTWITSRTLASIPEEDRTYLDPPPAGFRFVWWPIQWGAFYIGDLLSAKEKQRLLTKVRQAGVDFSISPEQFFASRIVSAIVFCALAIWVAASLHLRITGPASCAALLGALYPGIWLSDRIAMRKRNLLKSMPFFLDVITLCVEAGLNLQGAMNQAVLKGPKGVMRDELQKVLRDIRAGKQRAEALRAMADRLGEASITNLVTSLIQAESLGMNLGPVLRAQSEQRRSERFLRAEKLAMEAPVKMLLPLIAFIFPCTFIVLGFPIAMKFLALGL